jgi:hypothetical protein
LIRASFGPFLLRKREFDMIRSLALAAVTAAVAFSAPIDQAGAASEPAVANGNSF